MSISDFIAQKRAKAQELIDFEESMRGQEWTREKKERLEDLKAEVDRLDAKMDAQRSLNGGSAQSVE